MITNASKADDYEEFVFCQAPKVVMVVVEASGMLRNKRVEFSSEGLLVERSKISMAVDVTTLIALEMFTQMTINQHSQGGWHSLGCEVVWFVDIIIRINISAS